MADSCVGCKHWRPLGQTYCGNVSACHYLIDTGEQRGCPAENCIHHTSRKEENEMTNTRTTITTGLKAAMQADRDAGVRPVDIAEKYNVGYSTVCRHTTEKSAPESTGTDEEKTTDQLSDSIIAEDQENVNTCGRDYIPDAVGQAVLAKAKEIDRQIDRLKAEKDGLMRWYYENCTAFGRDYKKRTEEKRNES